MSSPPPEGASPDLFAEPGSPLVVPTPPSAPPFTASHGEPAVVTGTVIPDEAGWTQARSGRPAVPTLAASSASPPPAQTSGTPSVVFDPRAFSHLPVSANEEASDIEFGPPVGATPAPAMPGHPGQPAGASASTAPARPPAALESPAALRSACPVEAFWESWIDEVVARVASLLPESADLSSIAVAAQAAAVTRPANPSQLLVDDEWIRSIMSSADVEVLSARPLVVVSSADEEDDVSGMPGLISIQQPVVSGRPPLPAQASVADGSRRRQPLLVTPTVLAQAASDENSRPRPALGGQSPAAAMFGAHAVAAGPRDLTAPGRRAPISVTQLGTPAPPRLLLEYADDIVFSADESITDPATPAIELFVTNLLVGLETECLAPPDQITVCVVMVEELAGLFVVLLNRIPAFGSVPSVDFRHFRERVHAVLASAVLPRLRAHLGLVKFSAVEVRTLREASMFFYIAAHDAPRRGPIYQHDPRQPMLSFGPIRPLLLRGWVPLVVDAGPPPAIFIPRAVPSSGPGSATSTADSLVHPVLPRPVIPPSHFGAAQPRRPSAVPHGPIPGSVAPAARRVDRDPYFGAMLPTPTPSVHLGQAVPPYSYQRGTPDVGEVPTTDRVAAAPVVTPSSVTSEAAKAAPEPVPLPVAERLGSSPTAHGVHQFFLALSIRNSDLRSRLEAFLQTVGLSVVAEALTAFQLDSVDDLRAHVSWQRLKRWYEQSVLPAAAAVSAVASYNGCVIARGESLSDFLQRYEGLTSSAFPDLASPLPHTMVYIAIQQCLQNAAGKEFVCVLDSHPEWASMPLALYRQPWQKAVDDARLVRDLKVAVASAGRRSQAAPPGPPIVTPAAGKKPGVQSYRPGSQSSNKKFSSFYSVNAVAADSDPSAAMCAFCHSDSNSGPHGHSTENCPDLKSFRQQGGQWCDVHYSRSHVTKLCSLVYDPVTRHKIGRVDRD